jgi:O-antigen/teichoic acid export membrane protein
VGVSVIREGFRELPEILRFGVRIAPGGVATGLSDESATWSLGMVGTLSSVGAFSRAWLLARRFVDVTTRLMEMLFPTLVEHHDARRPAEFERTLVESMRYATSGLLLPASVGGGAAAAIMEIFGPGFREGATALALLLLVPVANVLCAIQDHALYAIGRPTRATVIQIARFFVTAGGCALGATTWGIDGAAAGLFAGYAVHFVLSTASVRPHLYGRWSTWWSARERVGLLAGYAAGFSSATALSHAFSGPTALVITLPLGSLVYLGVVAVVGGVNERDRRLLRQLRHRLRGRGSVAA